MKRNIALILGGGILAFGIYNIHALSQVTEGGILGLSLLLYNHFSITPAITNFILTVISYILGFKLIGKEFLINSIIATVSFCIFYFIYEQFNPVFPWIESKTLLAAIFGAIFVGVGAGLCVKENGAAGGDDAIAMIITHKTKIDIRWSYLIMDAIVIMLSLTYIHRPLNIIASVITVILSGQLVGIISKKKD